VGVAALKNIVAHDKIKAGNEGFGWEPHCEFVSLEKGCDFFKHVVRIDFGVHQYFFKRVVRIDFGGHQT
jgi:hypothetical protein